MHADELWQEYGKNGEPIPSSGHPKDYYDNFAGTDPRAICGTVHVWLYRDTPVTRELLFQFRSPKVRNPNTWDISAAGHINLGETRPAAALREAQEEIGATLAPEKLAFAFSYKLPGPHAIHNVYLYDYTGQPDNFKFQDGEVSDLKWIPIKNLDDFLKTGGVKPILASLDFYWHLLKLHLNYHEN
jgi:8-oxo-dGTP pyrophosphatase MutT (NUDIX family)